MYSNGPKHPGFVTVFCSTLLDNHYRARCHRFPDPISRAMRLSELHLCSRCLGPKHGANVCTVTCNNCRGTHNSACCHGDKKRKN
ncbi:unnamed protein product [Nippostrongylus brasiliensis]|uniref:Uncharacterized protein n=1 Tax=Nippostrongylus brasiliensis TaxID=27835 RepID=A0A0N4Y879_NIPBR|nr:unnamed protein product [Nippostrongylus brasiliensis]